MLRQIVPAIQLVGEVNTLRLVKLVRRWLELGLKIVTHVHREVFSIDATI